MTNVLKAKAALIPSMQISNSREVECSPCFAFFETTFSDNMLEHVTPWYIFHGNSKVSGGQKDLRTHGPLHLEGSKGVEGEAISGAKALP